MPQDVYQDSFKYLGTMAKTKEILIPTIIFIIVVGTYWTYFDVTFKYLQYPLIKTSDLGKDGK